VCALRNERGALNVTVYGGRRVPSRFCTTRGETHELCMRPDVGEETVEVNAVYNTEVAVGVLCAYTYIHIPMKRQLPVLARGFKKGVCRKKNCT